MSRPLSWFPLAGSDPVPGDPAEVRRAGERYAQVAAQISATAESLASLLSPGATSSEAVDAVGERARTTADEVGEARDRYEEVGAALVEYAGSLSHAQHQSLEALHAAQSAQDVVDAATTEVTRAGRALHDALEDDEEAWAQARLRRARAARDDGEVALARARALLEDAVAARDRAALRAVEAIRSAVDSDGLNDGWWDDWGRSLAMVVSKVAALVATVAGVLALVLCWVPVIGQALAAVALVAGAVALIADLVLLTMGDGSWSDVIWGLVGIVSFGAGRALGAAARASTGRVTGLVHQQLRTSTPRSGFVHERRVTAALGDGKLMARYRAQGLVGESRSVSPLLEGLRAYKPSGLTKEIREGFSALGDPTLRAELVGQGVDALRLGHAGGGMALAAALRTESDTALRALPEAGTVLTASNLGTTEVLRHARAEVAVAAVTTADSARMFSSGGAFAETYRWVTQDTPRERLDLP